MPITEVQVELDSRQRAPLAKIVPNGANNRYRVQRLEDGAIVMTSVVSLTERELAVLARPELVESIRKGITEAKDGRVSRHEPGSFAKILAEEGIDPSGPDEENSACPKERSHPTSLQ